MTSTPQPPKHGDATSATATPLPPTAKIKEAFAARDALAAALTRAGIQIPAMDVRTPWPDDDNSDGDGQEHSSTSAAETRYALVHLGVVSAPVAHALAEVIAKGLTR
ncbi:hypothetical protein ACGFYU_31120 [Streptomyces sp. NPDC048337]|uniref:hypothetical protein n=1 Tax=Streptomyces sp. NPDC048337 TaxID=3365535 RepID=UPI00371F4482